MRCFPFSPARILWVALAAMGIASVAGAQQSDDFNDPSLNDSLWRILNPVGDVNVSIEGFATGDSLLKLEVPAGSNHNLWWNANEAARVLQPVDNVDFEVRARYQSVVVDRFQIQGISIHQDFQNLLRFEFYSDNDGVHVFGAIIDPFRGTTVIDVVLSTQPSELQVTRLGNEWILSYAFGDGVFIEAGRVNYDLVATEVGVHAGNYSPNEATAPEFTALVDFFLNTASPIADEDGFVIDFASSLVESDCSAVFEDGQSEIVIAPLDLDGNLLGSGFPVEIQSSLGQMLGSVVDQGDGTYTQTFLGDSIGTAEIRATIFGVPFEESRMINVVDPADFGRVVGVSNSGDVYGFNAIQEAIFHAQDLGLSCVLVSPGHYDEFVYLCGSMDLRIEGAFADQPPVVRGFRFRDCVNVQVIGFDIRSGCYTDGVRLRGGRCANSGVLIQGCRIENNYFHGVRVGRNNARVEILDSLVRGNCYNGISLRRNLVGTEIRSSIIEENGFNGISISHNVEVLIQENTIRNNGTYWWDYFGSWGIVKWRSWRGESDPSLITLIQNVLEGNDGRVIPGLADENVGGLPRIIDETDDQAPYTSSN